MGGGSVIWDAADVLETRVAVMRDLPWPIPALVVVEFTDEDLDRLDTAADSPEYWGVLNEIVTRIQKGRQHE
jgi:hypothetical protein